MKRIISLSVLLTGLIGMLLGCDESVPLKSLPPQLTLETYKPLGEFVSRRTISADDALYQHLKAVLDMERAGWQRSIASYVTAPYVLRGENVIISCYADSMIIDVMNAGKVTSMRKRIPNLLQSLSLSASQAH